MNVLHLFGMHIVGSIDEWVNVLNKKSFDKAVYILAADWLDEAVAVTIILEILEHTSWQSSEGIPLHIAPPLPSTSPHANLIVFGPANFSKHSMPDCNWLCSFEVD